jgi:hypothetical protein
MEITGILEISKIEAAARSLPGEQWGDHARWGFGRNALRTPQAFARSVRANRSADGDTADVNQSDALVQTADAGTYYILSVSPRPLDVRA